MSLPLEEENKVLVRRFYDELNKGNLDIIDEMVCPDYVGHFPGLPDLHGITALKPFHQAAMSTIPPRRITLEDLIAEGDKVIKRYSVFGVHKGEILGVSPTNKEVNITGFSILRLVNGRIVEQWGLDDMFSFFQQLGVLSLQESHPSNLAR
jgi:predicted ester cyclase